LFGFLRLPSSRSRGFPKHFLFVFLHNTTSLVGVSDPEGPPTEPASEFIAACLYPDGLAQDGTQAKMYYPTPGVLIVGVTSVARERACLFARSPAQPPDLSQEGLGPPFYRCKERVQMYNGGCSNALTCPAEKCLSPVYMPTWLPEKCLRPAYALTWPSEECLSPVEAQLAVRLGSY
jgi:hypothetical protein